MVYVASWDSSVWGVAMGERCCRGSSVDVHEHSAAMYFLACGETFWDRQVFLSEISGIQIGIQFVFFQASSWLPSSLG